MATKKELEEQNLVLKEELRRVREENEKLKAQGGGLDVELDHKGISVAVQNGEYKLVEIGLNIDKGVAKILDVRNADKRPSVFYMAEYRAKEYLSNEILGKLNR